jgi:type IV secretory pathway VirB10-like protein
LGAAHASFYREVGMYERYEVRSRVLGWDQKWLVILSVFVRPGKKRRNETEEKTETVLASALSKYVVKKGRYTVPPEDCLAAAGWFEGVDRPEIKTETEQSEVQKGKTKDDGKLKGILKLPPTTLNDTPPMPSPSESTVMINRPHEQELEAVDIAKLEARAEEMSARVDEKWGEGLGQAVEEKAVRVVEDASTMENMARQPRRGSVGQQWTWEMIEKERLRGMEVARGWTALDGMLKLESERAVS